MLILTMEKVGSDLTKLEDKVALIEAYQIDVVFDASVYTPVYKANSDRGSAYKVNAEAVNAIAQACERATLLYCYTEDAPVAPLSYYILMKLVAEDVINTTSCKAIIFRTSWIYATHVHRFIKTKLRLTKTKSEQNFVCSLIKPHITASFLLRC